MTDLHMPNLRDARPTDWDTVGRLLAESGLEDSMAEGADSQSAHAVVRSTTTELIDLIREAQAYVDGLDPTDTSSTAVTARATVMSHREWIRHNFRRAKFQRAWDSFFEEWDVLICPQHIAPALRHDHRPFGERTNPTRDAAGRIRSSRETVSPRLVGIERWSAMQA